MQGLENHQPAHLTPLQQMIAPYALGIEVMWWILWGTTIAYLAMKFIVLPFLRDIRNR